MKKECHDLKEETRQALHTAKYNMLQTAQMPRACNKHA
jgi:hypothetical protein